MFSCIDRYDTGTISKETVQFVGNYGTIRNRIIEAFVDNIDKRLLKLNAYTPNVNVSRCTIE